MIFRKLIKNGGVSSYCLFLVVVAYFQSKVFYKSTIKTDRPNFGILFVDFFNFYCSSKFSKIQINPKISYLPIDTPPVRPRSISNPRSFSDSEYIQGLLVIDPFKEKRNLAKNTNRFLYMENLFYCIYMTLHQKMKGEKILEKVFKSAKIFQKICNDSKYK